MLAKALQQSRGRATLPRIWVADARRCRQTFSGTEIVSTLDGDGDGDGDGDSDREGAMRSDERPIQCRASSNLILELS